MRKIEIYLDYPCYPMWIYDENNELIDNMLAEELQGEEEIDRILQEIQMTYVGLFTNNEVEFSYNGFESEQDRQAFIDKIEYVVGLIREKVGDKYIVINDARVV
ncbi:hypothetical protein LJC34_08095 [Oscillospiraceae bacterium OttesenSCG-928-G22]|nr:hypothetical protein [Oscillospiraceae bacterium OttesenSCG-928-G22]